MKVPDGTPCDFRISFLLTGSLSWLRSLAATCYGQRNPLGGRCLSGRLLSPSKPLLRVLASLLGLIPPAVGIHRYGECEFRIYVPVSTGRRSERYRHLRPLPHARREPLWFMLQHRCGGIPSEARENDLTNGFLPGWPAPHSMEPETRKPARSQWPSVSSRASLVYYVQEEGVW